MDGDMYLVPLLPEELLSGYRGRLRFLNDVARSNDVALTFTKINAKDPWSSRLEQGFAEVVAKANQISIHDVVMQHTLWPFTKALGRPTDVALIEAHARSVAGRTAMTRCARRDGWFCMECVQEDLGFWHTSYWRRSHQLPGILWCDKHSTALHRVDRGAIEVGPPDHHLDSATAPDREEVRWLQRNAVIMAFAAVCGEVLTGGLTLSLKHQVDGIGRCMSHGDPCWHPETTAALLALEARRRVPERWLLEAFPHSHWPESGRIPLIDCAVNARSTTAMATLVLVAILAYGTSDRVLEQFEEASLDRPAATMS